MKKNKNRSSSGYLNKKGKSSINYELSDYLKEEKTQLDILKHWKSDSNQDTKLKSEDVTVIKDPFTCVQIKNFIKDSDCAEALKSEFESLDLIEKNNDLYKFHQSSDLKSAESPFIKAFVKFMYGPVRLWMSQITGLELSSEVVDLFCAKYVRNDYLSCHDDKLEGRKIAYIAYFVPESWDESDGGALDLFDRDKDGQPSNAVKSLCPRWNSFNFFRVSPISFHRVDEILSQDKIRWSIGGWFHAAATEDDEFKNEPSVVPRNILKLSTSLEIEEKLFYEWINPAYLHPETQGDIQQKFEDNSEISLQDFFNPEKFSSLSDYLKNKEISWEVVGPANYRHYDKFEELPSSPSILNECLKLLRSDAFFLLLSNLTGLRLHPLFESDDDDEDKDKPIDPKCSYEVRRWRQGCYTLIRDDNHTDFALDARVFFNVDPEWDINQGGYSSYVAKDEDEELLTAQPENNSLVLVYRDQETLKFVKYVNDNMNNNSTFRDFYDIELSYFE